MFFPPWAGVAALPFVETAANLGASACILRNNGARRRLVLALALAVGLVLARPIVDDPVPPFVGGRGRGALLFQTAAVPFPHINVFQ